jgi:predicted phage terminase large subunit-like protein
MIEIRPQIKQERFLSSPADIAIYGGSAGGGKTWALLLEPLRHIQNKRFGAVIFRRTFPEITREGGMWDEALAIYPLAGSRPNRNDMSFRFPSGSKIGFAAMQFEDDKEGWKSAQIPLIEFDQLETFTSGQFFYMFSRNRSTCGVKPYIRATCNPEPGWLADFLAWWIDEDGYANLERSGVLRWMVRLGDDQIAWYDSQEEATGAHPDVPAKSVTFIPATVYDNQELLKKDPGYIANLKALTLVDRERLLGDAQRGGNWRVKPSAGKVFNRAWFKMVEAVPAGGIVVRRWDFAATAKELNKSDPDYTASCLMLVVNGSYYILDVTAEQIDPARIDATYQNLTQQDEARFRQETRQYLSRWEQEPGSAGKRESWRMTRMVAGSDARGISSTADKLIRAKPLAAQAEAGNVYILAGAWNELFLNHMHGQPELPHDDIMDATDGAFEDLTGAAVNVEYGPTIWR